MVIATNHPYTNTQPRQVRRVVVVPGLWAPFHHEPAVAALTGFVAAVRPDGVVFMNALPADAPRQSFEAFTHEVTTFRTTYGGKIMIYGHTTHHTTTTAHRADHDGAVFTGLNVFTVSESVPIVPGWLVASLDPRAYPDVAARAALANTNMVCGGTGRLRLTGRAVPAEHDGTMRAWVVFECGTLAADPTAGTLGFGVLDIDGDTVTARPVRIGTDGVFTYQGTCYAPP